MDHPSAQPASEVLVIEPRAFEESLEIVEHLRGRKSVLLNLHMLDKEGSQRIVDFLSGACHAIDGHQQKIGDGVFLFAPATVVISSESNSSKAIKDAFWNKTQILLRSSKIDLQGASPLSSLLLLSNLQIRFLYCLVRTYFRPL